jgi:hypothetical protein
LASQLEGWEEEMMKRSQLIESLTDNVDALLRRGPWQPGRRTRHDQVQGLLDLAEELQGILVPVRADSDFRRRLHGKLILAAQEREPVPEPTAFQQYKKGILIGAAALGSVASVVGVILAVVLHNKNSRASQTATG